MRKYGLTLSLLIWIAMPFIVAGQTPLTGRDTAQKGPQTIALILGVSKYKYIQPLNYADKDAELFRDYLKSPGGGSVKNENIFCLLNEKASNANFWSKGFQWLKSKNLRKGDRLFIYLAGHGDAIDEDQFFFLGYDCNPAGDKNNYLVGGAIQLFNLKKKIANETTRGVEVYFIMDACRTNELPGGIRGQNFLNSAVTEKNAGEVIMLATGAGQESLEDASIGNGHGLFTYYLVDGLSGLADSIGTPDHRVSFREIEQYVDKNVPSVAETRFKRKQDPYFCCTENNEKIISRVDTAYLQRWLQAKKLQTRGRGNSVPEGFTKKYTAKADTILIETYNRFYAAVNNNKLTGPSSAEDYFMQLNQKFPGNPYTLDAKSTLAAEYINDAQAKINDYLSCLELSVKMKQANFEAGLRLQQAMAYVREDDADFANSLRNRVYLLKASGDFGPNGRNGDIRAGLEYAYAALLIDPEGAYILNMLAILHMNNDNADSARYYINKAINNAPGWVCATKTLSLIEKKFPSPVVIIPGNIHPPRTISKKPKPGILAGSGVTQLNPSLTTNRNDTLQTVSAGNIVKLDLGIFLQFSLNDRISLRPTLSVTTGGSDLVYTKRTSAGALVSETVELKTVHANLSLPVIFHLYNKPISPYFSLAPVFSLLVNQNEASEFKLPLKKTNVVGDAGFGVDIPFLKLMTLTPEIKYSRGITNTNENLGNYYTARLSSLKTQSFTFSLYLKGR
jgi:hypothetical protein